MADELIFLNVDPVYNIALYALRELNGQGRLAVTNVQQCRLNRPGIQSDNPVDDYIYRFGGILGGQSPANAFGRTASSVMRMVMLRAVGVADNRNDVPRMGQFSGPRNWATLDFQLLYSINGEMFRLANVADSSRYWSKYDQLNPPSLIREKVWNAAIGDPVSFNSMMLIFGYNFQELIEITTTAYATMSPVGMREGDVGSYVNVLCIRRKILDGVDGLQFSLIKNWLQVRDLNDREHQLAQNDDPANVWLQRLNDGLSNLAI